MNNLFYLQIYTYTYDWVRQEYAFQSVGEIGEIGETTNKNKNKNKNSESLENGRWPQEIGNCTEARLARDAKEPV